MYCIASYVLHMRNYGAPFLSQGTNSRKLTWYVTRQSSCHQLLNHDIIQKPFLIDIEASDFTKFTRAITQAMGMWACGDVDDMS